MENCTALGTDNALTMRGGWKSADLDDDDYSENLPLVRSRFMITHTDDFPLP